MSKCNPPYNNANYKAPRMQFAIDSQLDKAQKKPYLDVQVQEMLKYTDASKDAGGSYEDTGTYYHGSSADTTINSDWSTSDLNIYGSGFYTTTSKEVAQSYTKKGRGVKPTVYRIEEINKGPSKDLETTPARLYGRGLLDEYIDLEGKSLIEALDEFRNDSEGNFLSRSDVIEIIDNVFDRLARKGYTSVTHHGGNLTRSKTKHLVKIFLRPNRDIKLIAQ